MGGKTEIAGLSFQEPNTLKGIGIEALVSKILCQHHNNVLSPLDSEAARFFRTLRDFDEGLRDGHEPDSLEVAIDGATIERWMLKVLAGLTQARVIKATGLRRTAPWLEILFGLEPWPQNWGFHVLTAASTFHAFDGIEIIPREMGSEIWSGVVGVAGFMFEVALGKLENTPGAMFRPAGLVMKRNDRPAIKKLVFQWPSGAGTGYVEFTRTAQYDGPRPQDRQLKRE